LIEEIENMIVRAEPLAELTQRAIHLLSREVGVANTMRFLGQFASGSGNYTAEQEALFGKLTLEQILSEVRELSREQGTA
jgi:hypothetical protein